MSKIRQYSGVPLSKIYKM